MTAPESGAQRAQRDHLIAASAEFAKNADRERALKVIEKLPASKRADARRWVRNPRIKVAQIDAFIARVEGQS